MGRPLMWLNLYGHETVQRKLKNRQEMGFVFFGCFWAYVRQPHNHIGWATSMTFASINTINPRNNPWSFCEIFLRIGSIENLSFFELAILIFCSKKKYFSHFPMKISQSFLAGKVGSKFWSSKLFCRYFLSLNNVWRF